MHFLKSMHYSKAFFCHAYRFEIASINDIAGGVFDLVLKVVDHPMVVKNILVQNNVAREVGDAILVTSRKRWLHRDRIFTLSI